MDMHRLETVLFSNGERFPILVNVKTGIPDFYSTLAVSLNFSCYGLRLRKKFPIAVLLSQN